MTHNQSSAAQPFRLLRSYLQEQSLFLTGGPNADRVWDSAKYAYDKNSTVLVDLPANDGCIYRVQVTQAAHQGSTGLLLVFVGHVVAKFRKTPEGLQSLPIGDHKNAWVSLHTRIREGSLQLRVTPQSL